MIANGLLYDNLLGTTPNTVICNGLLSDSVDYVPQGLNIYVKDSSTWKQVTNVYVKSGGSWVEPVSVHVKNSGSWVQV